MTEAAERIIDKLLARYRRDAVLLHRPYPPQSAPRTNSKFGGLPRLPEHHEWPRMPSGVPLHFLAQIDCADIGHPSPLPDRGVLFFFGRSDDEQVWDADQPQEACRVLYVQDAFALTPPRAAPDDLPPIGGFYPPPFARPFLQRDEPGPNLYVEWPIQPLRFDSWPDGSAVHEAISPPFDWGRLNPARLFGKPRFPAWVERAGEIEEIVEEYDEVLERKRDAEYYRATQEPRPEQEWDGHSTAVALQLYGDDAASDAFPQLWSHVDFFCRALTVQIAAGRKGFDDPAATTSAAQDWIARAGGKPADDPVAGADRADFRAWIASLPRHPSFPFNGIVSDAITEASAAVVRAFAGDPERASLISRSSYDIMAPLFCGGSVFGVQFSQMLGHAPSAQEALSVNDPTVCLLSLSTDGGLGWMFGDVGECTFWISPQDLARRDFSRVWGTIEGH